MCKDQINGGCMKKGRKTKYYDYENIIKYYKANDKNQSKTSKQLGIPKTTFARIIHRLTNDPKYNDMFNGGDKVYDEAEIVSETETFNLKKQIAELKKELLSANNIIFDGEKLKHFISGFKSATPEIPEWVSKPLESGLIGVPSLCLSDWHFGEVVDPAQIFGVNEYNLTIAKARAMEVIDKAIDLSFNHIANPTYPGIVVPMLGDMCAGIIHEELKITGEKEVLQVVLELVGVLSECLTRLAEAFGKVFVPCVAGNHGRLSMKPRAKNMAYDNLDWLLYQFLQKYLEKDERIKFLISDGEDLQYKIYDYTYRISHGSQFSGGDGIIGSIGPIIRGDIKKRSSARSMNAEYDILVIGHFHQSMTIAQRCICNGSLVGYSEYASKYNFPFDVPTQNFWITHPDHGITFNLPIRIDDMKKTSKEWITW